MAGHDNDQEKTEQATAKRLSDARARGQVPRSRELATMLLLVGAAVVLWATAGSFAASMTRVMQSAFTLERSRVFDTHTMTQMLYSGAAEGLFSLTPFLLVTMVAATGGTLLLGGLNFSAEAISCKWERLDPIKGVGRLFSLRSLVELVKALAKFGLLLGCGIGALWIEFEAIQALHDLDFRIALVRGLQLSLWAFLAVTAGTVLIALIDVPYQWWEHQRTLRMSRQELRQETKESEGTPEVRQRLRAMQHELASRRMMEEVPKADVVVVNPTHFAVALRFDPATMAAPRVVAKGADHIAMRIREVARAHFVTTIEAPPLARAIFHSTKIGREIPAGLYLAVAQVLAYVFQLKRATAGGSKPVLPREFPIPPDLEAPT